MTSQAERRAAATMPTLLLLPGLDGTGALFQPFIQAWGERSGVQVIDYPVDQALDYAALVDHVRTRLPERPFVMLAESFSGPVAIALAADPPPALVAVVLCCSFARCPRPSLRRLRGVMPWLPMPKAALPLLAGLLFGRRPPAGLLAALAHALRPVATAVLRARLRAVLQVDMRARLTQVSRPLLVLRASHDRLVPTAATAELAVGPSACTRMTLDGPHLLLQASPGAAVAAIASWLAGLSRAGL